MKPNKKRLSLWVGMVLLVASAAASARMNKEEAARFASMEQQVAQMQARLERAERQAENLQQMYMQIQRLDERNRMLQGRVEELEHRLQQTNQHQRELYLDMDQRLQRFEAGGMTPGFGAGVSGAAETGTGMTEQPAGEGGVAQNTVAPTGLDEQTAYSRAFEQLKAGQYPEAIASFRAFLETFPSSPLAGNAQYWLGEAHYGDGNFKQAIVEFDRVRKNYPDSSKVPDAGLKLAYSYYALRQWKKARSILRALKQDYPNSDVAKLADDRLRRMKLEGH